MEAEDPYQTKSGRDLSQESHEPDNSMVKVETKEELSIVDVPHEEEEETGHQIKEEAEPTEMSWPKFSFVEVEVDDQLSSEVQEDVLSDCIVEPSSKAEEEKFLRLGHKDVKCSDGEIDTSNVSDANNQENQEKSESLSVDWTSVNCELEICDNKKSASQSISNRIEITHGNPSCEKLLDVQMKSFENQLPQSGGKSTINAIRNINYSQNSDSRKHLPLNSKPKQYTCEICNKSFSWRYDLVFHQITHTGFKPISCNVCKESCVHQTQYLRRPKPYRTDKNVSKAVNIYPTLAKDNACSKQFLDSTEFRAKKYRKIISKSVLNTVRNCTESTKDHSYPKELSLENVQTYNETEPLSFEHQTEIKAKHYQTIEKSSSKTIKTVTEIAKDNSFSQEMLDLPIKPLSNQHVNRGKKEFVCEICNVHFSQKIDLANHSVLHLERTKAKQFTCQVCNKVFSQRYDLVFHQRIHTGFKPFKRKVCHGTSRNKAVELFQCTICHKTFFRERNLSKHLTAKHSGDMCDKPFDNKKSLSVNQFLHSEVKSFQCYMCKKYFTNQSSLSTHHCLNSEVKSLKCDICDKSFTSKRNFIDHILSMHS